LSQNHLPKKVLICPLDWGLGHASRCIPLIREFQKQGAIVYVGGADSAIDLLKKEFPALRFFALPAYNIRYPKNGTLMPLYMLFKIPDLMITGYKEHKRLRKLHEQLGFDIVVSDNRFFCFNAKTISIYMTHQLIIPFPGWTRHFEFLGQFVHWCISLFYKKVLIPDYPEYPNLSGRIGHPEGASPRRVYTGPLSRLSALDADNTIDTDVLFMISGPEPQRSLFEDKCVAIAKALKLQCVVLQGLPHKQTDSRPQANLRVISHLSSEDISKMILSSNLVVSRSGYTTIMELASLKSRALLIPTPGQTEQEYLAEYLSEKNLCSFVSQKNLNEAVVLNALQSKSGFNNRDFVNPYPLLQRAIEGILETT
jgi:uncharacterized protein (TIGR00661 family)